MPSLEHLKLKANREIKLIHKDTLQELTDDAEPEERDTWFLKEEPAMMFLAGNTADPRVLMFLVETSITGDDPTIFANYILKKSGEFRYLAAIASGLRTKAKRAVAAAQTKEQLALTMEAIHAAADEAIMNIRKAQNNTT